MKLEINLDDRDEIATAVPLLQLILDGTMKPQSANPLPPIVIGAAVAQTPPNAPEAAAVFSAPANVPSLPAAPAPAMGAPTGSTVAPTGNAHAVDLDSKGLPWDARIHSSTKSKLKSGEWKEKRGVEAATIASIEAELRAAYRLASEGVDGMRGLHSGGPFPGQTVDNPAAVFGGIPTPDAAAVFNGAPPAPTAPPAPAAANPDPTTFEQLMPRLTPAISSGQLTPTALQTTCAQLGLASVVALQQNPAMVPSVWAMLKQQAPGLQ